MSAQKSGNWWRTALISAAGLALAIFNIASDREAPSQALAILQYGLPACAVIGLVGSLVMYLSSETSNDASK
jgi:hypothetical protein